MNSMLNQFLHRLLLFSLQYSLSELFVLKKSINPLNVASGDITDSLNVTSGDITDNGLKTCYQLDL